MFLKSDYLNVYFAFKINLYYMSKSADTNYRLVSHFSYKIKFDISFKRSLLDIFYEKNQESIDNLSSVVG